MKQINLHTQLCRCPMLAHWLEDQELSNHMTAHHSVHRLLLADSNVGQSPLSSLLLQYLLEFQAGEGADTAGSVSKPYAKRQSQLPIRQQGGS